MTTVPCPGCGARAVPTAGAPAFTRCPRCGAPLVLLRHDPNVEHTVREWLYRRPEADAAMVARLRAVARHTRRAR
jgi:tRNA(Ile2) C34 agmatinyltransferase TiaS